MTFLGEMLDQKDQEVFRAIAPIENLTYMYNVKHTCNITSSNLSRSFTFSSLMFSNSTPDFFCTS